MSVRSFFDSNILVYTDDQRYPDRHDRAKELIKESLRARLGVVSTQVLQEYFAVSTRKLDVPVDVARAKVNFFSRFTVVLIDPPLILDAIDLHAAHQVAIWDALIIRAAQRAMCSVLYSEDLQHGRDFDGVEVRNPFRSS